MFDPMDMADNQIFFLVKNSDSEFSIAPSTTNRTSVVVNGTHVSFTDQQPIIQNGRTLVPVRGVFEQLGFSTDWDNATSTATLSNGTDTIVIPVGKSTFTVNGNTVTPDVPAQIIGGRTMLPLRAICESLGSEVNWDGTSQTAIIEYKISNKAPQPTGSLRGNTAGNISNLGIAAQSGDWIYYHNKIDGLYRIKTDGTDKQKLTTDRVHFINVIDDWVYYSNESDKDGYYGKLYRIKTDGTKREKLNDESSRDVSVVGDWIYYTNPNDDNGLYRIKTDGTGRQKLADGSFRDIVVEGEWIYYLQGIGTNHLYRIKTDGTGSQRVSKGRNSHSYVNIVDGWIYHISQGYLDNYDYDERWEVIRIKTDGTEREKLSDDTSCSYLNVADGWVYYFCKSDGSKIYRMKTDGTDKQKLYDETDSIISINIVGDWIYYTNWPGTVLYRMKTDGTQRQLVE